jgi:hypothetical protein
MNETIPLVSGSTYYHCFFQGANVWNNSTAAMVAASSANQAQCAIAMTEIGTSGLFVPTAPTSLPAGAYTWLVFLKAGGSAAFRTDLRKYIVDDYGWDGSARVVATSASSGASAADVAAAVLAGLGQSAGISVNSPVGGSRLELFRADSYESSEGAGRTLTVTKQSADTVWPTTLTTVHFTCKPTAATLDRVPAAVGLTNVACTVTQATGSSQAFVIPLLNTQTDDLTAGTGAYDYWLIANKDTKPATLRTGRLTVLPDPTA